MIHYARIALLAFALVMTTSVVYASSASGGHAVNGNNEVRWGGSTKYSTAWNAGIKTWNGLSPVKILPDTWLTWQTLTVMDVRFVSIDAYGWWDGKVVSLNTPYMDRSTMTAARKQHVTTHELGHALGIWHLTGKNVMNNTAWYTALGAGDKAVYNLLWGN